MYKGLITRMLIPLTTMNKIKSDHRVTRNISELLEAFKKHVTCLIGQGETGSRAVRGVTRKNLQRVPLLHGDAREEDATFFSF